MAANRCRSGSTVTLRGHGPLLHGTGLPVGAAYGREPLPLRYYGNPSRVWPAHTRPGWMTVKRGDSTEAG